MTDDKSKSPPALNVENSDPVNVPTFGCVIYVGKIDSGVRARVANIQDLQATGGSEREALGKVIKAFKDLATERLAAEEPIGWLDPPLEMTEGEQKRFVPVHL